MGNPRRDEKPAAYAREAREFLRTRLVGRTVSIYIALFIMRLFFHLYTKRIRVCQVKVSMEYSRKVSMADGPYTTGAAGSADSRVMDFGSVFLLSSSKADGDDSTPAPTSVNSQAEGINVAELVVSRGFGTVIRHRDFEERSNYYDALLAAESRAISGKKGIHSSKDSPVMHITDLTTVRGLPTFFSVPKSCIVVY